MQQIDKGEPPTGSTGNRLEGSASPLIVGEVLFDCFSSDRRILGGAPFNVAWNLQGFGLQPTFLSAVGEDADGEQVRRAMRAWGMSLRGLQTVSGLPTGRVEVELSQGQPTFHILADQAYDAIQQPDFPISPDRFSMLYLGSLAFRSLASRGTIEQLIESGIPRFVDINIRQPWFDRQWLGSLLMNASWAKLSEGELEWITEQPCDSKDQIERAASTLREQYSIGSCYVTRGSEGACVLTEQGLICQSAPPPSKMEDTVGAGDAFSSATILGILCGRPDAESLQFASEFASRTCALQGATSSETEHYRSFLETLPFNVATELEA